MAYSLWKARFWDQSLVESVIPFLRIDDFKKDFNSKVDEMLQEHELHKKIVKALKILEFNEEQFYKNIKLINDIRKAMLRNYCK
ncbi:hypothetical protein [Flavobacterium sp. ZB4P23]|uniref:DUF6943 family protein n=1 Tax=Flavobacterium sp. ZB4P23 TaxID=2497484 RepID=UPI001E306BB2|nr:hypothetical protein [Flavobacterium sp. ZB4P23]